MVLGFCKIKKKSIKKKLVSGTRFFLVEKKGTEKNGKNRVRGHTPVGYLDILVTRNILVGTFGHHRFIDGDHRHCWTDRA